MDIMELFRKIGGESKPAGKIEAIVAGLGNPGEKYAGTRHNVGFDAVDGIAAACGARFRPAHRSLAAEAEIDGRRVLLLKPQTYMNNSGEGVSLAAKFYKLPAEKVIVLCDDVALAPGILRIRAAGSSGGQNGMKSIIECLGTENFPRVRIGVGAKPSPDYDLANWVLGRPSKEDRARIDGAIARVKEALPLVLRGEIAAAQSNFCREK